MADNNNPVTPPQATSTKPQNVDAQTAQKLRNIKIKTGVVKRLAKDKVCYVKEAEDQEKKIEKFKEEGKEELFIRQQVGNLRETEMMIPDVGRKLTTAFKELKQLLEDQKELAESEEYKTAVQVLEETEPQLVRNVFAPILPPY